MSARATPEGRIGLCLGRHLPRKTWVDLEAAEHPRGQRAGTADTYDIGHFNVPMPGSDLQPKSELCKIIRNLTLDYATFICTRQFMSVMPV